MLNHIKHKEDYINFREWVNSYLKHNNIITPKVVCDYFGITLSGALGKIANEGVRHLFHIQEYALEHTVKNLLDTNNIPYKLHDRTVIKPYELDFLLNNIAIETNDITSHYLKCANYHNMKTNLCNDKGIRLIHLFEWEFKNEKLIPWLLDTLLDKKFIIGARKCEVKIVNSKLAKDFINKYHLQGSNRRYLINIGLFYNNELLSVMSFDKPRFNNNYDIEILRYVTRFGFSIIGGAEKLFTYFLKNYNYNRVITYSDKSKFTGSVYKKLGFTQLNDTPPSAVYVNSDLQTIGWKALNDLGADKLIKTNYGKGSNNEDVLYKNGYMKVYNCGNYKFEYIRKE